MGSFKPKKIIDINGSVAISEVVLYGYSFLKPRVRWTYCCLFSMGGFIFNGLPSYNVLTLSQRKLARAFQMPYPTFRSHLKDLQKAKLVDINSEGHICLLPFSELEIARALEVKIFLSNKHFYGSLKFTLIPKSIFYAYPSLNPGAKFVYAIIRSLDWNEKGFEWHKKSHIIALLSIHPVTYKIYFEALRFYNLVYGQDEKDAKDAKEVNQDANSNVIIDPPKLKPHPLANKDTVYFNDCSCEEQSRAFSFIAALHFPLWVSRFAINLKFDQAWILEHPLKNVG